MTLHSIHAAFLTFHADFMAAVDVGLVIHSLQLVWEMNRSCRKAGYFETSVEELDHTTWGDGGTCSGLPTPMDVPTRSQAAARMSAAEVLSYLRQLAGRVWLDHPLTFEGGGGNRGSYADWEMFQG